MVVSFSTTVMNSFGERTLCLEEGVDELDETL
jgi:hypothetical protein